MTIASGQNTGVAFTHSSDEVSEAEGAGNVYFDQGDSVLLAHHDDTPPWYQTRRQQVIDLGELRPNWDSYGAPTISKRSIVLAEMLLKKLASFVSVEEPTVTASPNGNVGFCFDNGERCLDVEVRDDGTFEFVYLSQLNESKDEEGVTSDSNDLLYLLTSW